MTSKKWVVGLVLAALTSALCVALWRSGAGRSPGVRGPSSKGLVLSSSARTIGFVAHEPGRLDEFDLEFGLNFESKDTPVQVRISAGLVRAVSSTSDELSVDFQLLNVRVVGGEATRSEERAQLERVLSTPFRATYAASGRLTQLKLPGTFVGLPRSVVANVAAALQLVTIDRTQPDWSTTEPDATGECNVRYQCQASTCEKTKLSYLRVAAGSQLVAPSELSPTISSGRARLTFDPDAHLSTVDARDIVSLKAYGVAFGATISVHLQRRPTTAARPELGTSQLQTVAPWEISTERASISANTPKQALEDWLGPLERAAAAGNVEARNLAIAELANATRKDPRLLAELMQRVKSGGARAAELLSAAVRSRLPGVDAELAKLLDDTRVEKPLREQALRALALTDEPRPEGLAALERHLGDADSDIRHQAQYAYGTNASTLSHQPGGSPSRIVAQLEQRLQVAPTPEEQRALLGALGNTGSSEAFQAISAAARSPDPSVRRAALAALRLIETPEAQALIAQAVLSEPDRGVRDAAFFAVEHQAIEPFLPALTRVCQSDLDEHARGAAVRLLGEALDRVPSAALVLQGVADNDSDPDLRALATHYL